MDVSQCRQNKNGFQTSKSTIFTIGPSKLTRDIQICPLTSKLGVKYGCQTFSNLDVMHLNFFMMSFFFPTILVYTGASTQFAGRRRGLRTQLVALTILSTPDLCVRNAGNSSPCPWGYGGRHSGSYAYQLEDFLDRCCMDLSQAVQ